MDRLQTSIVPAAGRVLLAAIFIWSGIGKLMMPGMTVGYIASIGLPLPEVGLVLAIIVELGGGLLLLAGLGTRWVALALAAFSLFTAFVFHGFGDMNNQINAMKNIAMAGGFLFVFATGAGEWSLDAMRFRRTSLA